MLQNQYKGKLDKDGDEYMDFINGATSRMQMLIKDLLDYSRIGKNATMLPTNLDNILQEILQDLSTAIKESCAKSIQINCPL